MAGTGADPDQCQGSREGDRSDPAGGTAGVGEIGPQEDCSLGGLGADELGQWEETRLSKDEGWQECGAQRPVHVDLGGDTVQPDDPGTLSGIVEKGKGQEGSSHRVHTCAARKCRCAEVPDDLERNDARSSPIQANGRSLRRIGFPLKGRFCS